MFRRSLQLNKNIFATAEKVCEQGPPALSFHGYMEMLSDGMPHPIETVTPLFECAELSGRTYVFSHEILSDGSFWYVQTSPYSS